MKKNIFSFCFLSFSFFAHAFSFSIAPKLSYNTELRTDCIYDGSNLNSKLEWNSFYQFKAGFQTDFSFGKLDISNTTLFNLPLKNGLQYDSDWRTQGIKTNYSTGDLYSGLGFDFNLEIKYFFQFPYDFEICPVFSVTNSYVSLRAKNIYCWCGDIAHTGLSENYPWNSEYARRVKKYGIDLYNNITSVFIGAEFKKSFSSFFIDFKACFSPYTFIFSIDHHLNKEEGHYYQMIQEAIFKVCDFSLSGGFYLNKKSTLNICTNFSFCPEVYGDLYYGYFKIDNIIADETCSFLFSKFSVSLGWTFSI